MLLRSDGFLEVEYQVPTSSQRDQEDDIVLIDSEDDEEDDDEGMPDDGVRIVEKLIYIPMFFVDVCSFFVFISILSLCCCKFFIRGLKMVKSLKKKEIMKKVMRLSIIAEMIR